MDNLDEPSGQDAKKPTKHDLPQDEEGQLTIDVWQTPDEIVVQAIVGGVKPEDLDVSVTHDMVTLRGKREKQREVSGNDYFYQELYWGAFSRSILLPQEVDADEAQATIKNGLLTIHLPKLDKARVAKLKVKNE
ncbi:MAG: Protein containing Heat shock protein Hsp20 protein [Candidatus Azambacteria bacterium GW2011_GWC2_45_7b]|uniref:Protein containing Heat shock protein Hsp20 protein n=2 Tax=Parcubacteria group TaxID=1794811 RepID=A0A837IN97_9BACT|nr:MAG: Protein containing Heat shock protein Hsp20 protein [Candidatus Giovannonibacteria bacterium GW2011_GWA1_44_25]KKU12692.1 MAG: Protein containing Heat shock protein Hsp20 protein [Candidatus Azambacteria bacterium GW2011_GWC2_45_7b]KKU29943.1 MAG: Protein containing Heat shock protein Hsp20 protein [Candidatus Giovannonibacteria bacterium GW2011_GWB1_46_20]